MDDLFLKETADETVAAFREDRPEASFNIFMFNMQPWLHPWTDDELRAAWNRYEGKTA
jgi:hypothetical protein